MFRLIQTGSQIPFILYLASPNRIRHSPPKDRSKSMHRPNVADPRPARRVDVGSCPLWRSDSSRLNVRDEAQSGQFSYAEWFGRSSSSCRRSKPASLPECCEIDTSRSIPAAIAVAGPELQRRLLVAVGDLECGLSRSASKGGDRC